MDKLLNDYNLKLICMGVCTYFTSLAGFSPLKKGRELLIIAHAEDKKVWINKENRKQIGRPGELLAGDLEPFVKCADWIIYGWLCLCYGYGVFKFIVYLADNKMEDFIGGLLLTVTMSLLTATMGYFERKYHIPYKKYEILSLIHEELISNL